MQLRDNIFNSPFEREILSQYRAFFSVEEIEKSSVLQWVFGATIFSHIVIFVSWFGSIFTTSDGVARGVHLCWPYFQSCGELLFLRTLPEGYSQPFVYALLFGTSLLAVYTMYRKDWVLSHMLLTVLFVWHVFVLFVLTAGLAGNYNYYLAILSFVLLFAPHKEFFLKLTLVVLYFLSTAVKIHEGWILGTYFSALKTGLPLFPDWSIPIWTNLVIFMEMVGAWFLLSKRGVLQKVVFTWFLFFHVYAALFVGPRFPLVVIPTMLILFGPWYQYQQIPRDMRSLFGWMLIIVLFGVQSVSFLMPGDVKRTLEGNLYGVYMFEANHQCISEIVVHTKNGEEQNSRQESVNARNRCDPYRVWFALNQLCTRNTQTLERISWTFDHSINGGPFYRIVDVENACDLTYKPFSHNEWIKTLSDNPEIIGYPVENIYF